MPKQKFPEPTPSEIREARKYLAMDKEALVNSFDAELMSYTQSAVLSDLFSSVRRLLNPELNQTNFPVLAWQFPRIARFLTALQTIVLQKPNRCSELAEILREAKSEEEIVIYIGNWLYEAPSEYFDFRPHLFLVSTYLYRTGIHVFFQCAEEI